MTQLLSPSAFACPVCQSGLALDAPGPVQCPRCDWCGEAYGFAAKTRVVVEAEAALPEDAVCLHHTSKRATTVCAGTGDYICALCAVEIGGQTYSASYLDAGGKQTAAKAFDRKLPRPDSHVYLYLILLFVPYVNFVLIPFTFLWVPHAFVLYGRALRLRKQNPLFARVMSPISVVTQPILLGLVSIGWVVGVVSVVFLISQRHR